MSQREERNKTVENLRAVIVVVITGALSYLLYLILEPFVVPIAWAIVIVLSTWPLFERVFGKMRYRGVAALLATVFIAAVIVSSVTPLLLALGNELNTTARRTFDLAAYDTPPNLPWLGSIPRVGGYLEQEFNNWWVNRKDAIRGAAEHGSELVEVISKAARGVFSGVANLILCLFFTFVLFLHGKSLGTALLESAQAIGGARFEELLVEIRQTVKGAVYGVVLTAFVQGVLAGIGYAVAGSDVPLLLALVTMVVALVPFGPPLVYLPVAGSLVAGGAPAYVGVLLAVWGVGVVSSIDNVIRPLFISQAVKLPLALSFVGVIGGLIAFGVLGAVLGPVILAVAYALWRDWLSYGMRRMREGISTSPTRSASV